jgi:hypothetical protein
MAVFMLGTGTPLTHRAHEALDRALERALQRLAR